MSERTIDAAVIVVTYNHADHIAATLRALLALDPQPAELLVIDNASKDGTAALIQREFPTVRLIEAGANLGFAGGCNLGVRATTARIIVLANPDLLPQSNWLAELVRPIDSLDEVGAVGCKLIYPNRKIQHAGGIIRLPLALGGHRGVGEDDHGQYDDIETVDFVTGAALATPRTVWDDIGGMDETFAPAYYDDVDYCTQVRRYGHTIVYTPKAVATHHEGASVGHGSARYHQLYHINRLRYLFKYFNDPWLLRAWLPAELGHIRAVANNDEIAALKAVYLSWQSVFCGTESLAAINDLDRFPDTTAEGGETELQWIERQLAAKTQVQLHPLTSRWPLVAKVRNALLGLAPADYIRDIVQQQNDTNMAILEAIKALVRQRRAADAAALVQGMLLAKIMGK